MFSTHELDPRHPFDLSIVVSLFQNLSFPVSHDLSEVQSNEFHTIPEYFRGLGEDSGFLGTSTSPKQHTLAAYSMFSTETDEDENDDNREKDIGSFSKGNSVAFAQLPRKTSTKLVPSSVLQPISKNHYQYRVKQNNDYSPNQTRALLLQKLVQNFPDESPLLLGRDIQLRPTTASPSDTIHVFVDHSNILIGFYDTIKMMNGYSKYQRIQNKIFSFTNLSLILERKRHFSKRVLAGSSYSSSSIAEARALGYETCILERVVKSRESDKSQGYTSSSDNAVGSRIRKAERVRKVEQAVDDIIYLKILESLLDSEPATLVVATGDANPAEYSPGFFRAVDRGIQLGWKVELVAFNASIGRGWKQDNGWGDRFKMISLDPYVEGLLQ